MKNLNFPHRRHALPAALFALALLLSGAVSSAAQDSAAELKAKAEELIRLDKMVEAVPAIEKWIAADPNNGRAYEHLGFALLGKSVHAPEPNERAALRIKARAAFVRSKALGNDANLITAMIYSLPEDGSEGPPFSESPRSHALTVAGERAFTAGKIDEAIDLYKQAAAADAKNYFAPLFIGDMYVKKEAWADAETWYQKAIAIDPYRETAYRYSGTPLMRQKKYDRALERYIEAWITEPYSRFAVNGIIQWGQVTGTRLSHPKLDVPEIKIGADGKANSTLNVNPLADDGSMAWMAYVATREIWRKEKFAKTYPNEKSYRHSAAEEADALRQVVKLAGTMKAKQKNEQFEMIKRMDADGVLEAYVIMALPTDGIAQDHAAYLTANRDKLRLYVQKYVVTAGR